MTAELKLLDDLKKLFSIEELKESFYYGTGKTKFNKYIKYEQKTKIRWIIEKKIKNKHNVNLAKTYKLKKKGYI